MAQSSYPLPVSAEQLRREQFLIKTVADYSDLPDADKHQALIHAALVADSWPAELEDVRRGFTGGWRGFEIPNPRNPSEEALAFWKELGLPDLSKSDVLDAYSMGFDDYAERLSREDPQAAENLGGLRAAFALALSEHSPLGTDAGDGDNRSQCSADASIDAELRNASLPTPGLIALDLTEEQAMLLISDEHPSDMVAKATALYDVVVIGKPLSIVHESAALDYSKDSKRFYVSLYRGDKQELEHKVSQLQFAQRVADKLTDKPIDRVDRERFMADKEIERG